MYEHLEPVLKMILCHKCCVALLNLCCAVCCRGAIDGALPHDAQGLMNQTPTGGLVGCLALKGHVSHFQNRLIKTSKTRDFKNGASS